MSCKGMRRASLYSFLNSKYMMGQENDVRILIDNGHGVETPGKRSPDGKFREYAYARKVAAELVARLNARGVKAVRLVPEEEDISLAERVRRANVYCKRYGKDKVALVSVHCDASGNGAWMQARGWSAWTSRGTTRADGLADCLYAAAEWYFKGMKIRKDMSDGDPDFEAGFYLLRHTSCPAVLTENFFQDNRDDVAYLQSGDGFETVVRVHVQGILTWLASNCPVHAG